MGLLGSLISAAVKIAATPIAIVSDTIDVLEGEEPKNTVENIKGAAEDIVNGIDSIL